MPTAKQKPRRDSYFFDISTGLKRIIGRDLIIQDEIALFELVKNSYDAFASKVEIIFTPESIFIIDNGSGMTRAELEANWLRVAYSAKHDVKQPQYNLRSRQVQKATRRFAGSKGIGRFSADRLGSKLIMQTHSRKESPDRVERIIVDWDLFEVDSTQAFTEIPVEHDSLDSFVLPKGAQRLKYGTCIEIAGLRASWDRKKILDLKRSLAKLINPFGEKESGFLIQVVAEEEKDEDARAAVTVNDEGSPEVVNGPVGNFIFSTLRGKTTLLNVVISEDGAHILSTLIDRGEEVYRTREKNPFPLLNGAHFNCDLYYLNRAAKIAFTRRMGLEPVKFGSVFLFRNGFRVVPIGEENVDWFGINRRKQQGSFRFLGPRDLIGRIDVEGPEEHFKEASSRNQGLIDTPAVEQLREMFLEYCLKRLERYVVPVTWVDPEDKNSDDISQLLTDSGKSRVTASLVKLLDSGEVELLSYSHKLITVINERSSSFEESLANLHSIASKAGDQTLLAEIAKAEDRFLELRHSESEAIKIANEERRAKEHAQAEAKMALEEKAVSVARLEEERKRNLFLAAVTSLDEETILNMHHQISIYASDIKIQLENLLKASTSRNLPQQDLIRRIEQVSFLNQKVLVVSRLATHANFRMESENIEEDLAIYIEQYLTQAARPFIDTDLDIVVQNSSKGFIRRFRPMEVSVVFDNLVSNARKAKASKLTVLLTNKERGKLEIVVFDDGRGFASDIEDLSQIFELGYSRTSGSGIGLYHVAQILDEMGGGITAVRNVPNGAKFIINIRMDK